MDVVKPRRVSTTDAGTVAESSTFTPKLPCDEIAAAPAERTIGQQLTKPVNKLTYVHLGADAGFTE